MLKKMRSIKKRKPDRCQLCNALIKNEFVDGRTHSRSRFHGLWTDMCLSCHGFVGVGLGIGKGQLYRRWAQSDDMFVKVEG